jgi:hypothetical protein
MIPPPKAGYASFGSHPPEPKERNLDVISFEMWRAERASEPYAKTEIFPFSTTVTRTSL